MKQLLDFPKKFRAVSVILSVAWLSLIALAQDRPLGPPPFGDKHVGGDKPIDERMEEATKRGRNSFAPPPEGRVLKNGVLAPSKEDRAKYAAFLRMPETGLVRLLVRENTNYQPSRLNVPGGGVRYSFANVTHFSAYGSDLALNQDSLFAGTVVAYGFLTNLGDSSLEELTLADSRTRFIAAYKPATTYVEARAETLRFQDPIMIDGLRYQDKLPVEVNATYLLRSINYSKALFATNKSADPVGNARRTDVLVGFKIVRKDTDGSLTIAWKLLKKYSAPGIE